MTSISFGDLPENPGDRTGPVLTLSPSHPSCVYGPPLPSLAPPSPRDGSRTPRLLNSTKIQIVFLLVKSPSPKGERGEVGEMSNTTSKHRVLFWSSDVQQDRKQRFTSCNPLLPNISALLLLTLRTHVSLRAGPLRRLPIGSDLLLRVRPSSLPHPNTRGLEGRVEGSSKDPSSGLGSLFTDVYCRPVSPGVCRRVLRVGDCVVPSLSLGFIRSCRL